MGPMEIKVNSSEILSLIQHHLVESSLTESSKALQNESGVGLSGLFPAAFSSLKYSIRNGDWGNVLEILSTLTTNKSIPWKRFLQEIHELAILELGELGEMDLAFATLRVCSDHFDDDQDPGLSGVTHRSIERRLQALVAARSLRMTSNQASHSSRFALSDTALPLDYYGPNAITKQQRRDEIAQRSMSTIPTLPESRLTVLLQQAVKWQAYTGQIPMIKKIWDDDGDDDSDHDSEGNKRKKKRRKRKSFNLVLGLVELEENHIEGSKDSQKKATLYETNPTEPFSVIKLSKKTVVESCTFLPSSTLPSLITGSSDGFIEIWDSATNYTTLRTHDLPYQKNEELMCHDDGISIMALKVSKDGELLASGDSKGSIIIWKLSDGKILREFKSVHGGSISCLDLSLDASKVLSSSQDGTCREYGLRTNKMLREFRGHSSFVNFCAYMIRDDAILGDEGTDPLPKLYVITSSADGTLRVWDHRTTEVHHVLSLSVQSSGIVQCQSIDSMLITLGQQQIGENVHTTIPLHTPTNTLIAVSRRMVAHISVSGVLLRTFVTNDGVTEDLVTAVISPSNKWLYVVCGKGTLTCYDVYTGKVHKSITDFGVRSSSGIVAQLGLTHHPHKGILAAFSRDTAQKRGILTLWR